MKNINKKVRTNIINSFIDKFLEADNIAVDDTLFIGDYKIKIELIEKPKIKKNETKKEVKKNPVVKRDSKGKFVKK